MTKYIRPCQYLSTSLDLNDEEYVVYTIGSIRSKEDKWPNFLRLRKDERIRKLGIVELERILTSLVRRNHLHTCNDVYFLSSLIEKSIRRNSRLWRDLLDDA